MGYQPIKTQQLTISQLTINNKEKLFKYNKLRSNTLLLIVSLLIVNLINPAFAQTTFDPMSIGVGARALGMGKAYVAVGEEGDTIFTNPAGLGEIDSFQFTSMSGKVLDDVTYTVLGGVYPFGERSAFGIGYAAASVSGIEIYNDLGEYQKKSTFGNSVLLACYGRKITEKLSLGINLKYFVQDGGEIDAGDGSGMNLDIGLLQKGLGWLSWGVVGQNILSSGKMRYNSGEEAELPMIIKAGTRLHILGEEFEAAMVSPVKLVAVADADISLRAAEPTTTHTGLELSLSPNLTLRAGMDQDPKPKGFQNNLTAGVSLRFAGLGFHYAYHPYGEILANATHYFSISFDERGWPFEGPPDIFLGSRD
ncbi:hypothetical protein AMJ44_05415 [candidate division WOR-1 bacterium DG_54_3]|uniref:DUF5723 domain-containing protein n=1 Tax=candidate division WOR-1 bacterium DG_54_3 TaxID=1703775 RepID=A0A0S7Y3K0_UNCSA|nr:MAG: hypothetical protein AMJ44_05415 [candidate division WOR-1 bacterium DG_54_3]